MSNDFFKYLDLVEKGDKQYPKTIKQQVARQREMLKKYDFLEERGQHCIEWIEKFCVLTEGEFAGQPVELLLWQKWFIHGILSFWGNLEVEVIKDNKVIGTKEVYTRITNDVLLIIGSGNSKTTLVSHIIAYLMYSKYYEAPKIYIGSNAQQQSLLCFNSTLNVIRKCKALFKDARLRPSSNEIEIPRKNSLLRAMSSDGKNYEGIIPLVIMLDETHEMKDNAYATNLRKSTKREDALVIESTTMGTTRGGYLDERDNLARRVLNNEVENDRFFPIIFEQDCEQEVFDAYQSNDVEVFLKSNPSLGVAVSVTLLKAKIKEMIDDPTKRATNLTKNFNVPQNPNSSCFSKSECQTKTFDESIFYRAPVFLGLDMAYTRSPNNDLACLTMMTVNPFTGEEYYKDFYFIPKYYDYNDGETSELRDMIALKSKVDTSILYNAKEKKYGYQLYANRGDVIIINEELSSKLESLYGSEASCDLTGVTERFMIYYLAYLEKEYEFTVCKIGLDPNKANEIESFCNTNLNSIDSLPIVIKFQMEKTNISTPVIENTKDTRARGLVYDNNKLTELHFANVTAKETKNGIILTNPALSRKDGVIAHLAARSGYMAFTRNAKTGATNLEKYCEVWSEKLNGTLES